MKKLICLLIALTAGVPATFCQEIGSWKTYLAYYTTTGVAETNTEVFAVADGSLYSYGKEDNSLRFYSRQTGLNDNGISRIGYNPSVGGLVIVYGSSASQSSSGNSGNIDLLSDKGVYNLPYLKENTNVQDKTVHSISFYKEYAYLSTAFGILLVNMEKREITDTYQLRQPVFSTCVLGGRVYAATADGLLSGSMEDNLLDINNWTREAFSLPEYASGDTLLLTVFQNDLCFLIKSKGVYYRTSGGTVKNLLKDPGMKDMFVANNKLVGWSDKVLYTYTSPTEGTYNNLSSLGSIQAVSSLKDDNTYWVATGEGGLKSIRVKGNNSVELTVSDLMQKSDFPKRNLDYYLTTYGDKLLIAGGGRWTARYNNPGTLMTYENGSWFNFDENQAQTPVQTATKDYTAVAVDPLDPTHYFVASYGEGLLEFKEDKFVKLYTYRNSPLETGVANNYSYTRLAGLSFDQEGNLWITNCNATYAVKVLKPDGTWLNMPYTSAITNIEMMDKILITASGHKWMNIPYSNGSGVFVCNDNRTVDDASDDTYAHYTTFARSGGGTIAISGVYSLAEDKNGDIWLGTNKGILICPASVARKAASDPSSVSFLQITRMEEDGVTPSGYFLDGEKITSLVVDGGNRKWIGTESSGIFLVNEDGSETLEHFTTANSPILSDNVLSLAIAETTGEVFIGTDKGLISYMGGATQGSESYSDVYAFPNPVRPDDADRVTITGLMADSNVKITDLGGNLIYQAKSTGGQLTWNCRGSNGSRVATGIYLVLAATPEAKESVVTKIMVIK